MSSLLEPDSSFTQSALAESTTTAQSRSKKWRAPVWAECRRPTQDENQGLLYCKHCTLDSPPYGTSVSQNMTKHLKSNHKITVEKALSKNQVAVNQQLKQLWHQAQAEGDGKTEEFDTKILEACLDTAVITKALISLIVVRNLSFALVEWPEFYTFCQVLNRASEGKITTSHSGVYNKVKEA